MLDCLAQAVMEGTLRYRYTYIGRIIVQVIKNKNKSLCRCQKALTMQTLKRKGDY